MHAPIMLKIVTPSWASVVHRLPVIRRSVAQDNEIKVRGQVGETYRVPVAATGAYVPSPW